MATRRSNTGSTALLALLMGAAGVAHFVITDRYASTVPRALGNPRLWVQASGVAELVGAGLLAAPRTRRVGGWFVAALLVAVFPANVKMAVDGAVTGEGFPFNNATALWLRLPLQIPLVWWAVHIARRSKP